MPAAYARVATPVVVAPSANRVQLFTPPTYVEVQIGQPGGRSGDRPLCFRLASRHVSTLKEQLRADLTTAMKARDELVKATLRMTLTAIRNAEVPAATDDAAEGTAPEAVELSDAEVRVVIAKEAKKRAESAEAFAGAGRDELAAKERAEGEILARYLPTPLTDDELVAIARAAVEETAAELGEQPGPRQMGQVMKRAGAKVAQRADGGRVAAAVKALLVP